MNNLAIDEVVARMRVLDASDADKLWMFVQLCDEKKIMDALKHNALLVQMDMIPSDIIHPLVYGIMRLTKPHLFEDDG